MQSILRRVNSANALVDIIEFEYLTVNKIKQEVLLEGVPVHLSTAELEALLLFVDNANADLSRDFLVQNQILLQQEKKQVNVNQLKEWGRQQKLQTQYYLCLQMNATL